MTLANKITIGRLVLVPVFVGCTIAHAEAITRIDPDLTWRFAAIAVFAVASISDFFDGWIARRFQQKSLLGTTLDPIADKLLILCAIFTMAITPWEHTLPVWFVILVFIREAVILLGIAFMYIFLRRIEMGPNWPSKATTVLQMACVVWILIDFRDAAPEFVGLLYATAMFMVISTGIYVREGLRQIAAAKRKKSTAEAEATADADADADADTERAANTEPVHEPGDTTRQPDTGSA